VGASILSKPTLPPFVSSETLPNSMTFSVFMTISFDNANLVQPLLFAKAAPNLGVCAANAMSDACFFVPSMSIKKVMLER
jgi:hypothetical protein